MDSANPSFLNSFLQTDYVIFPDHDLITGELIIRIGENNEQLLPLLRQLQASTWAFITAWNPQVQILSQAENEQRNRLLKKDLEAYTIFRGEGRPQQANNWKAEQSFWVPGMSKEQAGFIGKKYDQRAIVFGEQALAELIWL